MSYGSVNTPSVTLGDVAAEIDRQKGMAGGIAGLGPDGKLTEMPDAADVGAVPTVRISTATDLDTLYLSGQVVCYRICAAAGTDDHRPTTSCWGTLISSDCGTKWQIFVGDNGPNVYYRTKNGAWTQFLTTAGGTLTGILNSASHINAGKASLNQTNGLMMYATYKADTSQGKWWAPLTLPDASGDAYGTAVILGTGGATFVSGGEAGAALYNALMAAGTITGGTEKVFIASDTTIDLCTNCQTIANRKTVSIDGTAKVTAQGGFAGDLTVPASTAYTTKKARNISMSTAAASGGGNGDIHFTYA